MLRIYDAGEREFNDNGIRTLKVYYANVIDRLNGDFYLELETSLEQGEDISQGNIITVEMIDDSIEAFRVRNITIDNERVQIKAWHVFYDSQNYLLENVEVTNMNGPLAIDWITQHTEAKNQFKTNSDIACTCYATYKNVTLYDAYMDLAEKLGGYLYRHLFEVKLQQSLGEDREVTISDGKNLQTYSSEENWDDVCTKIKPIGNDELVLPEVYLYSEIQYDTPYTKVVSFDSTYEETAEEIAKKEQSEEEKEARRDAEDEELKLIREQQKRAREEEKERLEFMMTSWEKEEYQAKWEANEEAIREAEKDEDEKIKQQRDIEDGKLEAFEHDMNIQRQINILREKATQYLKANSVPKVSYTVKADDIPCFLGDTIQVRNTSVGVDLLTNVTEIKYNAVTKRYDSITFGNYKSTAKSAIEKVTDKAIKEKVVPATNLIRDSLNNSKSVLEKYLYHSHIYHTDNATYFLNAATPEQATKFLVMTLGGIGFGKKNYGETITGNEEFTSAWDIESNFTADYITGGILQGLLFKGGAAEFETADGLVKILLNPDDGIRIIHKNKDTKEEIPILYINTEGFVTIVGDGTGLDIQSNSTIGKLISKINMTNEAVATIVSKTYAVYPSESTFPDGTWAPTTETNIETMIYQNAEEITQSVKYGNVINSINTSKEGVKINASKININGLVTFTDLAESGATVINGENIKTGTLTAEKISSGTLRGVEISGCKIYGSQEISANQFTARGNGTQTYTEIIPGGISVNYPGGSTEIDGGTIRCSSLVCGGHSFNGHSHSTEGTINATLYQSSNGKGNYIRFSNGGEGATTGWCANTFAKASASDMRLKKDIESLEEIEKIYRELKPKKYRFKDSKEDGKIHYGLLAQQVINLLEREGIDHKDNGLIELVRNAPGRDEGMYCRNGEHYRINYEELHGWHIAMINYLLEKVEVLEKKLLD